MGSGFDGLPEQDASRRGVLLHSPLSWRVHRVKIASTLQNVPAFSGEREAKFIAENSEANLIESNLPTHEESKVASLGTQFINRLISGPHPAPTMTTSVGCKGWMKARCGYSSCSKLIDHEREKQKLSSDRAKLSRRQSSRAKLTESAAWERESEWSMLPEVDKEMVKKKLTLRRKRGHKKSSKLAPSSALSPSDRIQIMTPDGRCSLRDPYADVREAARYNSPALIPLEVGGNAGSRMQAEVEANSAKELRIHPWKRTTFSCPSSDNEPCPTSIDVEGKQRKKKWTSNSSDDTECRAHRTNGSYSRSKSTWSRDSTLTVAEVEAQQQHEDNAAETQICRVKKGSRIIFLSTPPGLSSDDDDEQAAPGSAAKCSTECYGDYAKLESGIKEKGSRLDKTLTTSCEANLPPSSVFAGVFDANNKEWSKLDRRKSKQGEESETTSVRELAMVPTTKEPRHIDEDIEDQICRIESHDASDSSQGKSRSLRSSRRLAKGEQLPSDHDQFQEEEKPLKKKRSSNSTSSRRRKGRSRSKAPPPLLPNDLHGKVKESVAVVKSSYDPYNDFRTSMVEMIVEKEIQGAGDLEELLRCYLSLNSTEYHSVIVKVFADVWRELFSDTL
ncbi:hypothetical protein R1sor_021128 [Riccia sorocarpa]|uniref:OVATE domain-containing protein n=1 Tax=Riccia sorocarpa TaxID=122646 RepID=A0ABD3GJ30_9MARC